MGATTEFGEMVWGPARLNIAGGVYSNVLDDADDNVGMTFGLPRSGTITHVGWYLTSKTGTPPNYYVGLCVMGGSGFTLTAYGGSTPATVDPTALSAGWQWTALAVPAIATMGDSIAVRVWPTGAPGNPDASNKIEVAHSFSGSGNTNVPVGTSSGGTLSTFSSGGYPVVCVRYDDGVVVGYPYGGTPYGAYDNGDTPDEVGVKFTLPYAMRCIGIRVNMLSISSNCQWTAKCYDADDTLLASWVVNDEDLHGGAGIIELYWPSALSLAASSVYRATVLPTLLSAAPGNLSWPDTACKACYHQGAAFVATSRTDGGAWTDNADATVFISPIVDQITLPDGSTPAAAAPRWL